MLISLLGGAPRRARLVSSFVVASSSLVPSLAFAQSNDTSSPPSATQAPGKDAETPPAQPTAPGSSTPNGGAPVDTTLGATGARGGRLVGPGSRDDHENAAGLSLGARLGVALPMGKLDPNLVLSRRVPFTVPLALHLGSFITPKYYVGGYLGYDFARADPGGVNAYNPADSGKGTQIIRFGAQGEVDPFGSQGVVPWIGLAIGYAYIDIVSTQYGSLEATVPIGVDLHVGESARIGIYVAQTVGTTFHAEVHGWTTFGLRVVL